MRKDRKFPFGHAEPESPVDHQSGDALDYGLRRGVRGHQYVAGSWSRGQQGHSQGQGQVRRTKDIFLESANLWGTLGRHGQDTSRVGIVETKERDNFTTELVSNVTCHREAGTISPLSRGSVDLASGGYWWQQVKQIQGEVGLEAEDQREQVWEQRKEPPGQSRLSQGWGIGKEGLRAFTEPHGVPRSRLGIFYAIFQFSQLSGVGGFSSTLQMRKPRLGQVVALPRAPLTLRAESRFKARALPTAHALP